MLRDLRLEEGVELAIIELGTKKLRRALQDRDNCATRGCDVSRVDNNAISLSDGMDRKGNRAAQLEHVERPAQGHDVVNSSKLLLKGTNECRRRKSVLVLKVRVGGEPKLGSISNGRGNGHCEPRPDDKIVQTALIGSDDPTAQSFF